LSKDNTLVKLLSPVFLGSSVLMAMIW